MIEGTTPEAPDLAESYRKRAEWLGTALRWANERADRWMRRHDLMVASYEELLAKQKSAQADAWDEGWVTGHTWAFADLDEHARDKNPYRED